MTSEIKYTETQQTLIADQRAEFTGAIGGIVSTTPDVIDDGVRDGSIAKDDAVKEASKHTARAILDVLDERYLLIPQNEEKDLAMLPATVEIYNDTNDADNGKGYTVGLNLSGSLTSMFDDINS